nr:mitogen-activated protein kinase kinase kinase 2-like [Ipomoea batatas]
MGILGRNQWAKLVVRNMNQPSIHPLEETLTIAPLALHQQQDKELFKGINRMERTLKKTDVSETRVIIKQILAFTLDEKGTFVREVLLDELAKGLDALGLATLESVSANLPFSSSDSFSSMTDEDIMNLRNLQRLVLFLQGLDKRPSMKVNGINAQSNQRELSNGVPFALNQFESAQELLPLLSVIPELPQDMQQKLLLLPGDLVGKLASRVAARTLRRIFFMNYEKLELLGGGAHGIVFLAQYYTSPPFSVPVKIAVKSSKDEFSDSIWEEGQILRKFQGCPYIIQCVGDDTSVEHGNIVYNLLLEYAPGGTLQRFINSLEGSISEYEVSFYAYQLLKGIQEVHSLGFVHCDLKPNNVLLFPCECGCGLNQLKIGDFQLSKVSGEEGHQGALLYTSPESLFCGMHEAPKDIWAIGCMVAEMMAGKSPWRFSSSCNNKLALDMAFNQLQIPTGISDCAKDFLMRCFEKNPNIRWTADKLLNHPFIAHNNNPLLCRTFENHQVLGNRLFKTEKWISKFGLFSTPISSYTCGCRQLP